MFKTNPNESIHPDDLNNPPRLNYHSYGLTKREYFAAMAMQGALASSYFTKDSDVVANCAVEYSDALIAELNKTKDRADTSI